MKRRPIADRKHELEFFRDMLADKNDTRILLIQAASGWGKSNLLECFARECADGVCLVSLNLKGAEKGIAEVLGVFRQELGTEALPRFNSALAHLAPSVNIANNIALAGQMDISVVLSVDEQTRKFNLEQLENAFFEDLRAACERIVVILDTFEKAPPDLQNWLGGAFLRHIARLSNIRVVIAGQTVPERTIEKWELVCERRELGEIVDVDEWHTYVQLLHLPFPRDAVKAIVLQGRGHPRTIIDTFAALAPRWAV